MWRPVTESDIQTGIENGASVEGPAFDAKRELPATGKNKDLAKDICAMTVDGGTLIYGIGGDDATRPDQLTPFVTQGARERIDSVTQSAIAEQPTIETYEIESQKEPEKGYVCVVVPPSPRAPHMLTIDKDNRYWARGDTGNRVLTEGEVARLYRRRELWEVDRVKLLDEAVRAYPFSFEPESAGVVVVICRPVAPGRELLRVAAGGEEMLHFLMNNVSFQANVHDPFPGYGAASLSDMRTTRAHRADHWLCTASDDMDEIYQAYGEFASDGGFTYAQSPLLKEHRGSHNWLAEHGVERAIAQPLGVMSWLYERAGFVGAIDIGIAVLGIRGCRGITTMEGFGATGTGYADPDYRRTERVTGIELSADLDNVVSRLLSPLFEATSRRGYRPLSEREVPEPRRYQTDSLSSVGRSCPEAETKCWQASSESSNGPQA